MLYFVAEQYSSISQVAQLGIFLQSSRVRLKNTILFLFATTECNQGQSLTQVKNIPEKNESKNLDV